MIPSRISSIAINYRNAGSAYETLVHKHIEGGKFSHVLWRWGGGAVAQKNIYYMFDGRTDHLNWANVSRHLWIILRRFFNKSVFLDEWMYLVFYSPRSTHHLTRWVQLSTLERLNCKLHGIETGVVMSQYLAVSWRCDISRPLRCWYRNIGTRDTYRDIEGIAWHYYNVFMCERCRMTCPCCKPLML